MLDDLPATLGPYRVLRRLGAGGMAEVLLGQAVGASGFSRLVAIKRPLRSYRDHDELTRLLIAEARVGSRIHHRNLVAVHDLGFHEGSYYVVMDFVDGADLGSLRRRSQPSVDLAAHLVAEVLLGLHHLHRLPDEHGRPLGLVHRDVSPSNVLISSSGEVKLADYGIVKATRLAGNTAANIRRGKFGYMSPEQVAGEPLDARSDLFSVMVMFVELLTGERPFDGEGPAQVLERIREAAAPNLDAVPDALRPLVESGLSATPEVRHGDALTLRAALLYAWPAAATVGPPEVATWVAHASADATSSGREPTRRTLFEPDSATATHSRDREEPPE